MTVNVKKMKPVEMVRFLNSTELGTVLSAAMVYRHFSEAGYRIASTEDSRCLSFYRYAAWLIDKRNTPPDPIGGYEAHREAAAQRQAYAEGQRRFGALRRGGMGVEKNVEDGLEWYRKAAMQGDIYAAHELGDTYRFGDEVEPDIEEAMKWYSVAAEHGDSIAKAYCKPGPPYYPRTFPTLLGGIWVLMVYPIWWIFCLLRFIVRLIMDFIPTLAGRMKPKFRIVLPWWLALVVLVLCSCLLSDDWFKAWGKYPGLVVSTALCCLGIICLHWIKQRQLMKSVYVHILIALSYLLLWILPKIHYAIFG